MKSNAGDKSLTILAPAFDAKCTRRVQQSLGPLHKLLHILVRLEPQETATNLGWLELCGSSFPSEFVWLCDFLYGWSASDSTFNLFFLDLVHLPMSRVLTFPEIRAVQIAEGSAAPALKTQVPSLHVDATLV